MEGIVGDDYNCADGKMLARMLMRRRLNIEAFEIHSCMQTLKRRVEEVSLGGTQGDEDYMRFLNSLLSYSESSSFADRDDCNEEDDMDPQYNMFMENVREDGKSYILQISINNQALSVKYEGDSGSDGEGGLHSPKGFECYQDLNADDIDECYRTFLNSVSVKDDCSVFAIDGHVPLKYEGFDIEYSSDSEVFVTDNASDFNKWGCIPCKTSKLFDSFENEQQSRGSGGTHSVFRKKLMAKLGERFNLKEYERLWQEINKRRPKLRHHDLRGSGAVKQFKKDELGKSYLEQYARLKKKIDAAKPNRYKVLNLLRGFFFWLQNVAQEGAFHPWFDKPCLEAMPRNC